MFTVMLAAPTTITFHKKAYFVYIMNFNYDNYLLKKQYGM